jgi:hypothetical protein
MTGLSTHSQPGDGYGTGAVGAIPSQVPAYLGILRKKGCRGAGRYDVLRDVLEMAEKYTFAHLSIRLGTTTPEDTKGMRGRLVLGERITLSCYYAKKYLIRDING